MRSIRILKPSLARRGAASRAWPRSACHCRGVGCSDLFGQVGGQRAGLADIDEAIGFVMAARAEIFPMLDGCVLPADLQRFAQIYVQR